MSCKSAKELAVYKAAYQLSMEIFAVTKVFPQAEQYSLVDQIRRSSRSVCANLREAWAKRRYRAHFVSKLSDADAENSETDTWLAFARDCGYLPADEYARLTKMCAEIGAMLGGMIKNPSVFAPLPAASRLPTPDSRLPTPDSRLPTPDS